MYDSRSSPLKLLGRTAIDGLVNAGAILRASDELLIARLPSHTMQYAVRYTMWLGVCAGLCPKLTSTFRTQLEQQKLYDQRKSNPYPVAKPGTSRHERGLAWDSVANDMDAWIRLRKSVGWYVTARDAVHAVWAPMVAQTLGLVNENPDRPTP